MTVKTNFLLNNQTCFHQIFHRKPMYPSWRTQKFILCKAKAFICFLYTDIFKLFYLQLCLNSTYFQDTIKKLINLIIFLFQLQSCTFKILANQSVKFSRKATDCKLKPFYFTNTTFPTYQLKYKSIKISQIVTLFSTFNRLCCTKQIYSGIYTYFI